MANLQKVEQARAEAAGRRMGELIAEDVAKVLKDDPEYDGLLRHAAGLVLQGLISEMGFRG